MPRYKALYKKELADFAGVSSNTLRGWLNKDSFVDLEKIGYKKESVVLTPVVVKFMCEKYCITIDE
ncbi:MAG: hypothetical protein WCJ03_12575 [Bacteroidales bacterium]